MNELTPADSALLDAVQEPLPLVRRPFARIAEAAGLSEQEALERLARLQEQRYLRRLSVLLNGKKLGYTSTLVAAQVPPERVEEAAARISAHPGVSHNYRRDHAYNIWFTLAVPGSRDLSREVETLLDGTGRKDYLLLPAERTFKLRVRLPVEAAGDNSKAGTGEGKDGKDATAGMDDSTGNRSGARSDTAPPTFDQVDRRVLRQLQQPFPLVRRPWSVLAERAGLSEETFLARTAALQEAGVVRRISGVLYHRRSGYPANAMLCLRPAPGEAQEAGLTAASRPEVSHCILRRAPERWPYPLFAMLHGSDEEFCRSAAAEIAREIGTSQYLLLFSTREFKKERIYYTLEDV